MILGDNGLGQKINLRNGPIKLIADYGLSIKDKVEAQWDYNKPGEFTVFLDIKYTFSDNGLITDVNINKNCARSLPYCNDYVREVSIPFHALLFT